MRLELLAKDKDSGDDGCPSVWVDADDGTFVVQGEHVDNSLLKNHLPGEGGVKISPDIVLRAMAHYRERGLV
jgi:hypothetical protein